MAQLARSTAAGLALSAGRDLGRARHQLRGVLGASRRRSSSACSTRRAGARSRASTLPECTDEVWHGYLPDARAGPALRLPRLRPLRAAARPPLQSAQAAARSLCAAPGRRAALVRRAVRLSRELAARRPVLRPPRQRAGMPKARGDRRQLQLGRRPPARRAVGRHGDLRGACARPDHAARRTSGRTSAAPSPPSATRRHRPLRRLGVTAVELLPVHAFVQDRACCEKGLRNYWGYNTLGFFAPEPRYLSDGTLDEMRIAVRRLHAAGIEVILDVVYNHTAEGNELGPTLSFRGLDNASYYRLRGRRSAPLRQRHRHRQHAQPLPSARPADGDGFAALLGRRRSISTASASISASTLGREDARLRSAARASSTRSARTRCCRG